MAAPAPALDEDLLPDSGGELGRSSGKRRRGPPDGPSTLNEADLWPIFFRKCLDPVAQRALDAHFARGMWLAVDYGGAGGWETAFSHVNTQSSRSHRGPHRGLTVYRVGDASVKCRHVLLNHRGSSAAQHVFGSLESFVDPEVLQRARRVQAKFAQDFESRVQAGESEDYVKLDVGEQLYLELAELFCEDGAIKDEAHCFRHGKDCPLTGEDVLEAFHRGECIGAAASPVYKDPLTMSTVSTTYLKQAGKYALSFCIFGACRKKNQDLESIVFVESVKRHPTTQLLKKFLPAGQHLYCSFVYSPTNIGYAYERERRFTVAVNLKLMWPTVGTSLVISPALRFQHTVVASSSIYFNAPESALHNERERVARVCSKPAGLPARALLNETMYARLLDYESVARNSPPGTEHYWDITQNEDFHDGTRPIVRCQTMSTLSWAWHLSRWMIGRESMQLQGYHLFGEPLSSPFECPFLALATRPQGFILESDWQCMAGNGLHIPCAGALICELLSSFQHRRPLLVDLTYGPDDEDMGPDDDEDME